MEIRAIDLLTKYIDYHLNWSSQQENSIKTIKLQQLSALQLAFDVSKTIGNKDQKITHIIEGKKTTRIDYLKTISDLDYFRRSEFLKDRPTIDNSEIEIIVRSKVNELFPGLSSKFKTKDIQLFLLFSKLLNYKINPMYPMNYGSMQEGFSYGVHYSNHLIELHQQNPSIGFKNIDEILTLIIDPKKQSFQLINLIEKFNYPESSDN